MEIENYYTLINKSNPALDSSIVNAAVRQGIVPSAVRYDLQNSEFTGIIKSTAGNTYFFQYEPDNSVLKAFPIDRMAERRADIIFSQATCGFDIIKSDTEETTKAAPPAGGGGDASGGSLPAPIDEEQAVAGEQREMTEIHPGAAEGVIPDDPAIGRQWHQDAMKALSELDEEINKSIEVFKPSISSQEKQFMVEVLGRDPYEVDDGHSKMTPTQKVTYQRWLAKSVSQNYRNLNGWLAKRA